LYILKSQSNGRFYVGSTDDLARRLEEHDRGQPPPPGGEDRGSSFIRSNSLLFKKPANVNVS
jgi:hypothetical protein